VNWLSKLLGKKSDANAKTGMGNLNSLGLQRSDFKHNTKIRGQKSFIIVEQQWYFKPKKGGARSGPFSIEKLVEVCKKAHLNGRIRRADKQEWIAIEDAGASFSELINAGIMSTTVPGGKRDTKPTRPMEDNNRKKQIQELGGKEDVLAHIKAYNIDRENGDDYARSRLFKALDNYSGNISNELDKIEADLNAGHLQFSNSLPIIATLAALRQVYGASSRTSSEMATIEEECRRLIARQKALLGLRKAVDGQNLSTDQWAIQVIDNVAAELMPKYSLSRTEFQRIIKNVWG
jgi:hypothetical protein